MKKFGFTLAEVLVTLGIIGVVAALTTPALIQNVGNAKVPPRLAKAKATFETAAEMMLTENSVNTIRAISSNPAEIGKELGRYMKISKNEQGIDYTEYNSKVSLNLGQKWGFSRFDSDDGMTYWFAGFNPADYPVDEDKYTNIPNNQAIGLVWVDINGAEEPNSSGKDAFRFVLYNDGTLRPNGAHGFWRSTVNLEAEGKMYWDENHNCNEEKVAAPATCAGSIFDHGMKIIYQ